MAEKYNPSEEEVDAAKGMEEHLLREQYVEKETERMNQELKELFPNGFTGFVDRRSKGEIFYDSQKNRIGAKSDREISGEINGHTFSVQEVIEAKDNFSEIPKRIYTGIIDGKKINEETAKDLFLKYYKAARRMNEKTDEANRNDSSVQDHIWKEQHRREEAFEREEYDRAQAPKKSLEDLGL